MVYSLRFNPCLLRLTLIAKFGTLNQLNCIDFQYRYFASQDPKRKRGEA